METDARLNVEADVSRYVEELKDRLDWLTSVVRQTVDNLLSLARARFTFSRMSDALAVQMKGFGSTL